MTVLTLTHGQVITSPTEALAWVHGTRYVPYLGTTLDKTGAASLVATIDKNVARGYRPLGFVRAGCQVSETWLGVGRYYTPNLVAVGPKLARQMKNLRILTALVVDLDYHKVAATRHLSEELALDLALGLIADSARGLALPNAYATTGGGLHLYWRLTPELARPRSIDQYNAVGHRVCNVLDSLSADRHGCAPNRVFRLPGALHENGRMTEMHILDEYGEYNLFELAEALGCMLPTTGSRPSSTTPRRPAVIQRPTTPKRTGHRAGAAAQLAVVFEDLRRLAAGRCRGQHRQVILWTMARLCCELPDCLDRVREFNGLFHEPYDDDKLVSLVAAVRKPIKEGRFDARRTRRIRVDPLVKKLWITDEIASGLGLRYFVPAGRAQTVKIDRQTRYNARRRQARRGPTGNTPRQAAALQALSRARELCEFFATTPSAGKLARKLGCSRMQAHRLLRGLRKV